MRFWDDSDQKIRLKALHAPYNVALLKEITCRIVCGKFFACYIHMCKKQCKFEQKLGRLIFLFWCTCVGMYCCSLHFANFRKLSTVWELTQIKDMHWSSIYTLHKGWSIFLVVIFSSPHTINLYRNKSSFTFWKKIP